MAAIIDKCILLVCCLSLIKLEEASVFLVASLLAAITLCALNSYLDRRSFLYSSFAVYCLVGTFVPALSLFLPLVYYDIFATRFHWSMLLGIIPLSVYLQGNSLPLLLALLLFLGISLVLRLRTVTLTTMRGRYRTLRDSTKEFSLQLERKNKDLMEKQDYEIRLATLNERNRIAREIHDNVGHLLSSSILQVGALMAVNRDPGVSKGLTTVKETLSTAMGSIRSSVHNLHDESIDLYDQLNGLVQQFRFCPVTLDYNVEGFMSSNLKYCLITIIKEALSNVIKHSHATHVTILVKEHPAFYQLIVKDNGNGGRTTGARGIGLRNIEDRIAAFGGNLYLDGSDGFQVFISIPKEEAK